MSSDEKKSEVEIWSPQNAGHRERKESQWREECYSGAGKENKEWKGRNKCLTQRPVGARKSIEHGETEVDLRKMSSTGMLYPLELIQNLPIQCYEKINFPENKMTKGSYKDNVYQKQCKTISQISKSTYQNQSICS